MSLPDFIFQVIRKKKIVADIKKILIIRNDHIGDVCLSLPVCALLKNINENICIHFLISGYAFDIAEGSDYIDKIIVQNKNDSVDDIIAKLEHYDVVLNLCSKSFNAELCGFIKAPVKIGFAYKLYNIFNMNTFVFTKRKNPPIHETDFCFEFLKLLFYFTDTLRDKAKSETKIRIDGATYNFVENYLSNLKINENKKIVAIHSGDNNSAFNISINRYIELAEMLERDFNIIFIFGPGEIGLFDFFKKSQIEKFYFVKGDLSLKQLCAFISKMNCLVSGSTGPMHIAGLMSIPTVTIFSNKPSHSFRKWSPINNIKRIIEPEIKYNEKTKNEIMNHINLEKIKNAVYEIC